MKTEILNKLTPEGRERIIYLEGQLRQCDEEITEIDALLSKNMLEEME